VSAVAVLRQGSGPEVLLVHGGATPRTTWAMLTPLSERWTLALVHRRGYPPSPEPRDGNQDFEVDAGDIEPLLAGRPHVVMHSYGSLGALIAAARVPENVRSLTVIEPPLGHLVRGDPEVDRLVRLGDDALRLGLDMDPAEFREFWRIAGGRDFGDGPLPEDVAGSVRRAQGARLTSEAQVDLDALRRAGIPALVASGGHAPALERLCDGVAERLGAERVVAPGAGHFVASAPGFPERLEEFLQRSAPQGR
jgi:pimeloyl-ACP methyl ester carboxylesterase